jgi:hypothetical protein
VLHAKGCLAFIDEAVLHVFKELQRLLNGTLAPGRELAFLEPFQLRQARESSDWAPIRHGQRTPPAPTNLIRLLVAHVGKPPASELDGAVVQLLKII